MRAGKLRDLLTIQEPTITQDDYGGVKKTWNLWRKAWANIEYLTGRELWQAQQANSQAEGRITVRSGDVDGIKPKMRIKKNDNIYEILAVFPADNRGRETQVLFRRWLDE